MFSRLDDSVGVIRAESGSVGAGASTEGSGEESSDVGNNDSAGVASLAFLERIEEEGDGAVLLFLFEGAMQ